MKVVDLYFESINQMTIPQESKQRLEGGLSVATNSLLIWTPIE